MRKFAATIESTTPPPINSLWINDGEAKYFSGGIWRTLTESSEDRKELEEKVDSLDKEVGNITTDISKINAKQSIIELEIGNSEEVKARNLEKLKSIQTTDHTFFTDINFGYGTGKWLPSTGGNAFITTAEGVCVDYTIDIDGSISKIKEFEINLDNYIKYESNQIKLFDNYLTLESSIFGSGIERIKIKTGSSQNSLLALGKGFIHIEDNTLISLGNAIGCLAHDDHVEFGIGNDEGLFFEMQMVNGYIEYNRQELGYGDYVIGYNNGDNNSNIMHSYDLKNGTSTYYTAEGKTRLWSIDTLLSKIKIDVKTLEIKASNINLDGPDLSVMRGDLTLKGGYNSFMLPTNDPICLLARAQDSSQKDATLIISPNSSILPYNITLFGDTETLESKINKKLSEVPKATKTTIGGIKAGINIVNIADVDNATAPQVAGVVNKLLEQLRAAGVLQS